MTTTQQPFTAEAAIAFINDLEGINGNGCVDIWDILCQRYGEDDADKAAVVWCLDTYEKVLDPDDAWAKVDEWAAKENIPLKGRYLELCQKQVQDGIDGNNGNSWLNAHHAAVTRYALVECFDDQIEAILSGFAEYVYPDDMDGLPPITGFQYVEAAKPIIKENAELRIKAQGIKGIFADALCGDEGYLGNPRELLKAYVERHSEDKVALVEAMIDHEYWDLEVWLCSEEWYEGLEDAFTVKAKEIYKKACIAWDCEGNDVLKELSTVVRQALAKGGVGSDEIIEDEQLNEEIAAIKEVSAVPLVGEELLTRISQLEQSGVASKDVLIRCGYYVEGGDYGKANVDFFDAKLKAQKANGSWEKAQQESKAKEAELTDEELYGYELEGKRVCITGKLTSPRYEVEGWLSDVGATVVSGVSKTTDALIVGEKAGSKLDKAKELGIKILTEEEAHALLGEVNDGITEAWAKRIIERLLSDLPDADVPGYFKLTDAVESKVVDATNKEELRFWLSEQIGLESIAQRYIEFSDVEKLKVTWLELDQEDYVTVWYYDNECGGIDRPTEVSFNNHQDALSFVEEKNGDWGGHLSTIKVCEQKGDTFKMIVGDELKELNYPYWEQDLDMVLGNLDYYSEVSELLSDEPEDPRKELHEIMRKGLWPKTN